MSALENEWPDGDRRDDALIRALCDVYQAEDTRLIQPSQTRVLEALSHGSDANGAAEILGLSAFTVREHTKNARRALRAKNTTHACCEAIRLGLIR